MEKITLNSAIHLFSHLANITSCMATLDSVDSKKLKEHRLCLQGSLGRKAITRKRLVGKTLRRAFCLLSQASKGTRVVLVTNRITS